MKKRLLNVVLVTLILVGIGLLLFPTVSTEWNTVRQSRVVASYVQTVAQLEPQARSQLLTDAATYNADLHAENVSLALSEQMQERYADLLNVDGSGVMGSISISKIECVLPIYHGTSDSTLRDGVGHLETSSLPIGGEGTHSVLAGHSGLPSAKLFTDIDQLEIGDTFTISVLSEELVYRVDKIDVVKPDQADSIQIVEGKDYCTLVTCVPYGTNTHRLLVRGERVVEKEVSVKENASTASTEQLPEEETPTSGPDMNNNLRVVAAIVCVFLLSIVLLIAAQIQFHKTA